MLAACAEQRIRSPGENVVMARLYYKRCPVKQSGSAIANGLRTMCAVAQPLDADKPLVRGFGLTVSVNKLHVCLDLAGFSTVTD
jgi:hypothetical protein